MRSNELYPGDPGSVLHLNDQAVLVASDVKNDPIVATNTCVAVLVFDVLRRIPVGFHGFVVPALQGAFGVGTIWLTHKM